ncbi:MAG: amidohydrolase family protein [Christensenellales bacterium]
MNRSFETPAILHKAGVPFAIITDDPVITIEALPLCAGLAVRHGLPEEEAWKAITIYSATYTGIGERVGSLEVGKDADVETATATPLRTSPQQFTEPLLTATWYIARATSK